MYNTYRNIDPDIILINSHGKKNSEKIKLFNYTVYQKNNQDTPHDGIAIAIKRNIQHKIHDSFQENFLEIEINCPTGPIIIGTCYLPPRRPIFPLADMLKLRLDRFVDDREW